MPARQTRLFTYDRRKGLFILYKTAQGLLPPIQMSTQAILYSLDPYAQTVPGYDLKREPYVSPTYSRDILVSWTRSGKEEDRIYGLFTDTQTLVKEVAATDEGWGNWKVLAWVPRNMPALHLTLAPGAYPRGNPMYESDQGHVTCIFLVLARSAGRGTCFERSSSAHRSELCDRIPTVVGE